MLFLFEEPYISDIIKNTSILPNCLNELLNYFKSVYVPVSTTTQPTSTVTNVITNNTYQLNTTDIYNALIQLDVSKGPGSDGIPPVLLRNCCNSLVEPLRVIFNMSLKFGIFPETWKTSFIIPIFKKGQRSDVQNYRGISILSAIPKLFESIVNNHLIFLLKSQISQKQHGFMPARSTTTNLATFTNFTVTALENGNQVDTIYTDFSKAFDVLDHGVIISKLSRFNIGQIPLSWFESYLTGRSQFVKLGDATSKIFAVTSGVPQGSHLGPTLFNIFLNDVVNCFKNSNVLMYADDLKIYNLITSTHDCHLLQKDLGEFWNWCENNKLKLNVSKCAIMSFSKKRSSIIYNYKLYDICVSRVKVMRDLGVIFSTDMSFTTHIDFITSKHPAC